MSNTSVHLRKIVTQTGLSNKDRARAHNLIDNEAGYPENLLKARQADFLQELSGRNADAAKAVEKLMGK